MPVNNLLSDVPTELPAELFETILQSGSFRIERIASRGHSSPEGFWYDQGGNEWVLVLRGAAKLQFDGERDALEMKPGDFVNIPAHKRHRVEWTDPNQPTIWLAIHYGEDVVEA